MDLKVYHVDGSEKFITVVKSIPWNPDTYFYDCSKLYLYEFTTASTTHSPK